LSGRLPELQKPVDRRGRSITWQSAITNIFMGLAFLAVAVFLVASGSARNWWFWLLIPAFGCFGSGVAQFVQLKKLEKTQAALTGQNIPSTLSSAPPSNVLPPDRTDYVAPPGQSIYGTGELEQRPGSVTEGTTRHLEINSEGETITLPKK
jgi:hypothetical protein